MDSIAILIAITVIWWFAIYGLLGNRLGVFHWVGVVLLGWCVPFAIADMLYKTPTLSTSFLWCWNGLGLLLAMAYLFRRRRTNNL
jgi:hypothetical protein